MMDIEYSAQTVIEHLTAQKYKVTVERDRLIDEKISLIAQRDELLAAAKEYLPYMPSSTAKDGVAASFSAMLRASDNLKDQIAKCEAQS